LKLLERIYQRQSASVSMMQIENDQIKVTTYDNIDINSIQAEAAGAYLRAQIVMDEAIADSRKPEGEQGYFEYVYYGNDATWLYAESFDGLFKELLVFDTQINECDSFTTISESQSQIMRGPEGIFGRAIISGSGAYISGAVDLPKPSQISGINNHPYTNYIYTGFSGSNESDLGLQYVEEINGYLHYALISCNNNSQNHNQDHNFVFVSPYDQIWNGNCFLPSTENTVRTIYFTTYANYSNTGRISTKLEGYARYDSIYGGTPGAYWKISIRELQHTISSVTSFKLVNSIAKFNYNPHPSGSKSWCRFYDIKIDGVTPNANKIITSVDYASVSINPSSGSLNTVIIEVSGS